MLYLEDYLEIIETLPAELREKFTYMRELDLQVQNEKDKIEQDFEIFFNRARTMPPELREQEFQTLKHRFDKILECADEKRQLSTQLSDLVDRYIRRLDHDLERFKMELEADNPGITETLEKRAVEYENPSTSNHFREKRKNTMAMIDGGKYNNLPTDKSSHHHHHLHNNSINGFNVSGANDIGAGQSSNMKQTKNSSLSNHHNINSSASGGPSSFDNCLSLPLKTKLGQDPHHKIDLKTKLNLSGPIAVAASQAIAATQQLPTGRRTASLKASYEAFNLNPTLPLGMDDGQDVSGTPTGRTHRSGPDDNVDKTKKSRIKRNKSINNNLEMSNLDSSNAESNDTLNNDISANEPRYCFCNNVSYGEMIFCECQGCPYQWFHYECVNIKVVPEGSWFCPSCRKKYNDQSND